MDDVHISSYMRFLGAFALVLAGVIVVVKVLAHDPFTTLDGVIIGVLVLTCLALIRPASFETVLRAIVERIPGIPNIRGGPPAGGDA